MVFAVTLAGAVLSAVVLKRSHHPFVLREMKTAVDSFPRFFRVAACFTSLKLLRLLAVLHLRAGLCPMPAVFQGRGQGLLEGEFIII